MSNDAGNSTETGNISAELYQELVHYFKYASSAYCMVCPRPNGQHLVTLLSNFVTDVQGFIARDNDRRELIVSLRGSLSVTDFLMDTQILLVPVVSPGVSVPSGIRIHSGFLVAWNSVALQVIAVVSQQLKSHPGFSIVTTGHSLGGALSSLAAMALRANFPESNVRAYSYGAPRVGNGAFAEYFNEQFGSSAYRVVHANDGVPTMIPTLLGYHHHGIEYWQKDPPSEESTIACDPEGEDATCSASIPTRGINQAHTVYFGIQVATPFCL